MASIPNRWLKGRTVAQAMENNSWIGDIHGALSLEGLQQFFSSETFWEMLWKSLVPSKCKIFLWLATKNKCWTADRLAKRGLSHPERCLFCDQEEETVQYILTTCVFARQFWFSLLAPLGLSLDLNTKTGMLCCNSSGELDPVLPSAQHAFIMPSSDSNLWHRHLGHAGAPAIQHLSKTQGIPYNKSATTICHACQQVYLLASELSLCSQLLRLSADVATSHSNTQYSTGGKSAHFDRSYIQLEAYSTHQQVVSFVWAVLTRIVPEPLLGNSYSKRSLRINIWNFIKLRRFETFYLSDCIAELKVSHYSWISNIGLSDCFCSAQMAKEIGLSNGSKEQNLCNLLHCWISWMFFDIVIPLVQTYFYVTERESRRYEAYYYPKTIWRNLTSNAIASLNIQNFKILRGSSRKAVRRSGCSSRVRFVPKAKDMRPLVNLKGQSKHGLLDACHLIIKKVRDDNPEMFGSSVFDYNNVHQKLCHFLPLVRSHLKEKFKIYVVVADVSKAFDCIKHDMMLKVVHNALKSDDYVLRKCTKVVCNRSNNATYHFNSDVSISNGSEICDFSIQLQSGSGILVDQGKIRNIRKTDIQHFLSNQVKCNILKIGKYFYSQKIGIAQGSKLSPNLCSLYYGHLENSVLLKFLHDGEPEVDVSTPESLLMRFIDDFIFISFSKEHAQKFFNRMRRGFTYYNCYMNDAKYGFNFEVSNSEHCCNRIYRGVDGFSFIPWSGLLINCETLEIQADYTRYLDVLISSTITVKMHSSMKYLQSKLCHYMRPKCHPIFYDSTINSPGTVRLNIYQAFLLCAMKFHCYVRTTPDVNTSKLELFHIIKRTFRYMHSLIVRRIQDVELQYGVRPFLKLKRKETMWLGLSAYLRVLQKKQSRYKDLLALLREEIGRYGHLDLDSDGLHYAVDDSHSSMFWKFKF
ncbi:hypothetical protein U9M48_042438 [Paspalum notatum var. saurae]|uniref:Telomerase reverse transcriptase n=1 Tax=Paspalum notatum var. saurae TaxID=547442 RepID=A0AAQ3UR42_PASNO